MADLFFDQEFRALIAPLQPDELRELEASLIKEGNREPIIIWKEKRTLLDGHHRYDLCDKHGIELKPPHELSLPDRNAAKIWIINNQFGRRNINAYQRSVLALELEELLKIEAENRMLTGKKLDPVQNSAQGKTRDRLAQLAHVSHDTIEKVKKIKAKATPEQKAKLISGQASINEIFKRVARKDREDAAQQIASQLPEIINPNCDIRLGDFRQVLSNIPANSIDLIFTDPPYDAQHLDLWLELGKLASRVLKPGALFVSYSGQTYLPEVITALGTQLEYIWLGALIIRDGPRLSIFPRHIWATIKPILFYAAPPFKPKDWFTDSYIDRNGDKEYHDWQQTIEAPVYFIEALTNPGDIVLDPFLGTGTNALAALKLGRRFIGCEINQAILAMAQNRISEMLESNVKKA